MLKGRLHILLFVAVSITVMLISYFSFRYLYNNAAEKCMYDKNGIELCHPNPALIGQKIADGNSMLRSGSGSVSFSEAIAQEKSQGGTRSFPEAKNRSSEIVNIYPVKGSDWIVATHANIEVLNAELSALYTQFVVYFLITAFIIIACCLLLISQIYGRYEKAVSLEINTLNEKVNTLGSLNEQLAGLQQQNSPVPLNRYKEIAWKQIITYLKDELIHLDIPEIAFFLNGTSVTIMTHNGKRYSTALSLDELMKQLDNEHFHRANRQFIINLNCIKTIYLYGKNQLKIVASPEPEEAILISKSKVSEFKKWLDR